MRREIATKDCWESLNDSVFRLRSGLRFRAEGPENDFTCFLEDSTLGRSYVMSKWQRWFIELIESRTPAQDAARLVIGCFPELVTRETIVRFFDWLEKRKLLQKVATFDLETGHREEKTNPPTVPGIGRFRFQKKPILMNSAAVILIAIGLWTLSPSFRISSSPKDVAASSAAVESGGGMLEFNQVVPIRATTAGVLTEVLVRDGDAVDAGDILVRIEDPIAIQNLQDLKLELGECRVRRDRYYRTGNREKYTAELHRIADFSRRIGSHEAEMTLAEMRAPVAGLVETEVLCGRIGAEVARGDMLLTVHPRQVELFAGNP